MTDSAAEGSHRVYAKPTEGHRSLGAGVRQVLFWGPMIVCFALLLAILPPRGRTVGLAGGGVVAVLWAVVVGGVRVVAEWERGVILQLGKLQDVRGPGIFYVIPVLESVQFIDTRTLVINIPRQKVITRDNVPAEIDSALFFKVNDAQKAVASIQDFRFAVSQYAQAALRDVVGGLPLDDLLSEREHIQQQIKAIVEAQAREWGMHIDAIRLQDIELPEDLKRMMSRQASAEREKRATITKAEGDRLAARSLAQAAAIMARNPIALELRTLQSIDGLGASPSNTVLLFPVQMAQALSSLQRMEPEPPDPTGQPAEPSEEA
ncbi:membrane protease subunit, stomatin/prohibitin [Leptolyngbya sp. BL0902]|uniref:SPFH domain-containing protein n=1 Tax=Leptolyngbya sp. BL0902 TaxID=1115757 RepID=UPI0018E738A7|nr:SPFH domain-containing protein [Leptolyngbya sp. BL0902]QQE66503.1 membrane protease subunit, stomatin/prohibitin [Leptolyngbya sp. BL0902]